MLPQLMLTNFILDFRLFNLVQQLTLMTSTTTTTTNDDDHDDYEKFISMNKNNL